MSLKIQIQEAMKTAMRNKAKERLGTIRLILADLNRVEVDERIELSDDRILVILDKMQKQRRDSIAQFEDAGRDDLASKEKDELEVIAEFLPEPLNPEALQDIVNKAVETADASTMADMGKVMAIVKPQVQGRANMSEVSKAVKSRLS